MSHEVREPAEDEILRKVGDLLAQAKQLTGSASDRPGTKFLDYMISLALIEVGQPTKE